MKTEAIMKALGLTEGRGMAQEALNNLPEGGRPAELPAQPEIEAGGRPDLIPPVETAQAPDFDEATGLPLIGQRHVFDGFPGAAEETGEAGDVLDFLF